MSSIKSIVAPSGVGLRLRGGPVRLVMDHRASNAGNDNEEQGHFQWWSSSLLLLTWQPLNYLSPASPSAHSTSYSDSDLLNVQGPSSFDAAPEQAVWPRSMGFVAQTPAHPVNDVHRNASAIGTQSVKQLRFIPSDGQPHRKRRRITAACLTCRKRKVRCSGERPECNTCTENGQSCSGYTGEASEKGAVGGRNELDGSDDDQSDHKVAKTDTSNHAKVGAKSPSLERLTRSGLLDQENTNEFRSPESNQTTGSHVSTRNRAIPYFRYFGPTAIVPGFKQMVVQLKDHRRSTNSISADSPGSLALGTKSYGTGQSRPKVEIPFYDATDPSPNAPLITHLCETFFTYLGCNYPFLQHERFMRDLEDKRVDAILVDAVCGLAARFSSHSLLAIPSDDSVPTDSEGGVKRQFKGHPFVQRAMSSVTETFACPTIAVAQACLLLAYEEFGSDHDSGLWMYLGTSIRMAQDLGIQKLEGLQLEGRIGPTPQTSKAGPAGKDEETRREAEQCELLKAFSEPNAQLMDDRRASERERIDTFFAILFLDRAVSSGVGRPVTLRDRDIEISFPYRPDEQMGDGWPHPFPPMIQTVHVYGRVADVLNNLKHIDQVTPGVLQSLAGIEKDLTMMYQRLSPKLNFNPVNFQHYVKAQQGTNFILLHFWFHSLIIILHQPTLLHSFEGRIQQLFPDSRELSMSSAKTIADIIAFAELIDVKSIVGSPFTSQPMYIAARAFLAEAAIHTSQPTSRGTSPPVRDEARKTANLHDTDSRPKPSGSGRSSLLHSAANTNYQRCYKALTELNAYWAGCRYILVALDQMSKGLMDPLLFTSDDVDEMPSTVPSFTTPGWRHSTTHPASMGAAADYPKVRGWQTAKDMADHGMWSPDIDLSQAIGWSMTGTANSPAPNVSFLYQNRDEPKSKDPPITRASQGEKSLDNLPNRWSIERPGRPQAPPGQNSAMMPPPTMPSDNVSTADADLLLSMQSPYQASNSAYNMVSDQQDFNDFGSSPHFADMPLITQDVDMSNNFAFPGVGDVRPWLEYLPQDVLSYFSHPQGEVTDSGVANA